MPRFAATALLIKQTHTGINYQLMLDVLTSDTHDEARAFYAIKAKDTWPNHGLSEILVVEVIEE